MKRNIAILAIAALFAVGMSAAPANAGLLKSLGNTVDKTVDKVVDSVDKTVDRVTNTVDSTAGTNTGGVVNNVVTINDDDGGGLVNLNTTGESNIATATVGVGGASVGARVGGLSGPNSVSINLGGLGLDLVIDVGTPNPNDPNAPNNPGGGPILVGSLGGAGAGTFVVTCAVDNAKTLLQLAANGKVTAAEIRAWQRSANVQVIPIALCRNAKSQISKLLARSPKINLLRRAVTTDNLIMASLSRTRYEAKDVVAVQRRAGQLVVYVY